MVNVDQSCRSGNWKAIFKAVHDLIIIMDIDNRIIDANPAVFKTTGLREDQVLGQFCYKIFHCSEKPPCECPYEKLKKSHHQESFTMEMEALGRKYIVTVAPIFEGESKQVTKIIHIAKDITTLKEAESALLYSEKKFQGIFDAASDGILVADIVDKKFVDANRSICEMLGYTRDELLKLDVGDIHPQEELPLVLEVFEKQVSKEMVLGAELPVKRKDGSIFYADISSRPVKLGGRQFLIGIFRDATLRIKNEQLLKEEKNKAQKYLDVASVMLVALNTEGEITLINQQGCNVLKVDEKYALGKNWFDSFIPKEAVQEVKNVFKGIMSGNLQPVDYYENQVVTQNGELRTIAFHNTILTDEKGVIVGTLSSGEDITYRKEAEEDKEKLEQQIQKNKKLESLGTLAGGIAHDFNNILSAILGNINLALFDEALQETTINLLAESEKASLRAKDLVHQLLTFSRGGEPVRKTIALDTVIKDSANFVLHGDNIACQYNIPVDLWLADIDKGQISQVIQNIVINAKHAMPEGGIIEISCENVSSADKKIPPNGNGEKFIKITIKDSGIGIPTKLFDKIFDPYFSTKQEGSGLGLAICQSIISKHNGYILVESVPEEGTTFIIYLPASDKTKIQGKSPVGGYKPYSPVKILIMDDEEMVRDVAKAMLTKLGNTVVLAADGVEAVKCYQASMNSDNPIQLVIMDLTVPGGMGGKDAVLEIHKLNPEAKVIVSSGYSNDPVIANFKKYGFCAAISKPFQLQDLSRVLCQVMT